MKQNSSTEKSKNRGFTLVELIVVIAILAILSAVGAVAYTGYIEYTKKGLDKKTVGEIMNAAELANYDDPSLFKNGATIFITDTGLHSTPAVETAFVRTFGDLSTVKLSYDGWEKPNISDPGSIIEALKDPGTGSFNGAVGEYLASLEEGGAAASYVGHAAELWDEVTKYVNSMNGKGEPIPGTTVTPSNDYLRKAVTYSKDNASAIKNVWTNGIDVADMSGGSTLAGQARMTVRLARNQAFAFYAQTHPSYNAATMKDALEQCKKDLGCCYCDADYLSGTEWNQIKADYLTNQAAQDANAYLGIMEAANVVNTDGNFSDDEFLAAMSGYTDLVDSVLAGANPTELSTLVTDFGDNTALSIGVYQGKNGDLRFTFSDNEINPRKESGAESAGDEAAGTECSKPHTPANVTALYNGSKIELKSDGNSVASIELCSILEDYNSCTISPSTSYFTGMTINIASGNDVIQVDDGTITALKGGTATIIVSCTLKTTFSDKGMSADPITITVNVH